MYEAVVFGSGGVLYTGMRSLPLARLRLPVIHIQPRRRVGCVLAILVVLVCIALGSKGWQLYTIARPLLTDVRAVAIQLNTRPTPTTLVALQPVLARIRSRTVTLQREAAPLLLLTRWLRWVPVYGTDIAAAEPLLAVAVDLAIVADQTAAALAPAIQAHPPDQPLHRTLLEHMIPLPPELEIARQSAAHAAAIWESIPIASLSPPLRQRLEPLVTLIPLTYDALMLTPVLPDMLGANGPRQYLFIAQNPDEVRATGGFIGAAGILRIDSGQVTEFVTRHSGAVSDYRASPYPLPPEPFEHYMQIGLWAFHDANWSPDFPTSARVAMDLYQRGQGPVDLDGVIAMTPAGMQLLLAVIGPVTVLDVPEPVSATNLIDYMRSGYDQELTSTDPELGRKAYLARLADAVVARIAPDPLRFDLLALAQALRQALDERHILIYTTDPVAGAFLAYRGWDGGVQPGADDFLLVVDSNMGFNKVNANIEQSLTYVVDLTNPTTPEATLSVRHTHTLPIQRECRQRMAGTAPSLYEELVTGCYWNYLRVFIPSGSQLLNVRTNPVPAEWMLSGIGEPGTVRMSQGEGGSSVLSTFLVVPAGESRETLLRYRLPSAVLSQAARGWRYRLKIQKQSGREPVPVVIQVRLPSHARLVSVTPAPTSHSPEALTLTLDLARDRVIEVVFVQ